MGNCFGKESSTDNFTTPGRTVGSAPPPALPRASVPKISGQGRSLGGGLATSDNPDARSAAARAAEDRAARANQPKGKLGQVLAKERQQTRTGMLGEASREERRMRDADEAAEARNYN
ncbi:hypothetical protein MMC13_004266 [Lambiella insularis]|nr:hypothetical protein [Lambiella insularis]